MAPSGTWWSTLEPGALRIRPYYIHTGIEHSKGNGVQLTFLRMEAREEYGLNHDSTRLTL